MGEKQLHEGDKWIEEFACINIFEEIFNNYNIQVLSDYNTATAEYNFILLFAKEEENQKCMDLALQACGKNSGRSGTVSEGIYEFWNQ